VGCHISYKAAGWHLVCYSGSAPQPEYVYSPGLAGPGPGGEDPTGGASLTSHVEIRTLSHAVGVEVRGLDLRDPVDDAVTAELEKAYADGLLVLFRGQQLSAGEQVRAVGMFGPVLDEFDDGSSYSLVSNVERDAYIGSMSNDSELVFHSDLTNTASPPWGLSLYAMEISGQSPVTAYVNAQRAYELLSPALQAKAEQLEVIDIFDYPPEFDPTKDPVDPQIAWASDTSTHPVVIDHPRNGKKQVYCNRMWSNRVAGMDSSSARSVLDELFSELYQPSNIYQHEWAAGDLIVWDNIAVQHGRKPIPPGCRRRLRRVSIGEKTPELIRATRGIRDLARLTPE
jgi:taurine dioxygenase